MEKATVYQTITLLSNSETVSKQRGGMCPAAGGCHGDAHLKIENSFEAMHLILATYVLYLQYQPNVFARRQTFALFCILLTHTPPGWNYFAFPLFVYCIFRFLVGFIYF